MTMQAASGEGAPVGAPRPGSCEAAAIEALTAFAFEERLAGAAKAHESFDGILAEHALALEEARDELRKYAAAAMHWHGVPRAMEMLDEQIQYVRALGSVAAKEESDAQ